MQGTSSCGGASLAKIKLMAFHNDHNRMKYKTTCSNLFVAMYVPDGVLLQKFQEMFFLLIFIGPIYNVQEKNLY